jgi:hypothetical protein
MQSSGSMELSLVESSEVFEGRWRLASADGRARRAIQGRSAFSWRPVLLISANFLSSGTSPGEASIK